MSRWARAIVVCALMLVSAGCLRYHAELRVGADGMVSGRLVVAFRGDLPTNLGQRFEVPEPVRDKVEVADYDRDGYRGSTISFQRLSTDEIGVLFGSGQRNGATVRMTMTRTDDGISVTGLVFFPDLSLLGGNEGFDARIALSFAGASTVTGNGTVSGQDVTWSPRPGQPLTLSAEAVFPRAAPEAAGSTTPRSRIPATLFIGLSAVLAGVVVLLLARLLRHPAAVAHQPAPPPAPYAGPYPTVPFGPGLSPPQRTEPLPTVPIPDDPGPSYRPDQAGW